MGWTSVFFGSFFVWVIIGFHPLVKELLVSWSMHFVMGYTKLAVKDGASFFFVGHLEKL